MNVAVTGGAGFIGSHTVERLLSAGIKVTVIDNLATGCKENLPAGVPLICMDILDPAIHRLFSENQFDAVIHLAAQTKVPVSQAEPMLDCQLNVTGTVNILEACRKTGVKRVVFASTAAVYGDAQVLPIKESTAVDTQSFYGLSKLTVEKYLEMYYRSFGLEYVVLRYANVYGERQCDGGEGGVVSIFSRKVAKREAVTLYGDGEQTRDFIYAGDIAEANYMALHTAYANCVYNVSTMSELSVNSLVRALEEVSGLVVQVVKEPMRAGDIYRSCLDHQQLMTKLNWAPKTDFLSGLARTYRWACSRL